MKRMPWARLGTVGLLGVALVAAISQGQRWDAAVIAVLLIIGIALMVFSFYVRRRARDSTRQG
jgi:DMSO reductase anchor subunit